MNYYSIKFILIYKKNKISTPYLRKIQKYGVNYQKLLY